MRNRYMSPYSRMLAATLALLVASSVLVHFGNRSARAAEVECVQRYEAPETYPEDIAKGLWPSGFRPTVGMCERGFLHGTIVKGDYEKVAALYRASHRLLRNFSLLSPGGDAEEAMKIGRLLRRYLFHAAAPTFGVLPGKDSNLCTNREECLCASACALIWFGAVDRLGEVGLHRPRTADPRFRAMPPADASLAYKRILDEISRYLEEMEAPRGVTDAMVATSSSEIRWVDYDRDGLERPPSIAEWTDASCGAFTKNEFEALIELEVKKRTGLTANEQMLLKFLKGKDTAYYKCRNFLFFSHVDRLPPPDVVDYAGRGEETGNPQQQGSATLPPGFVLDPEPQKSAPLAEPELPTPAAKKAWDDFEKSLEGQTIVAKSRTR